MGLKEYQAKRNFKKTAEPPAIVKKSAKALNFCIQKHAASHLHYDFRLEYKGVLLSWAVPKGPSLNPQDKRLAIQVEDHPLDYQYFEGVIPKGNYGAGTVEIWDHGTYTVPNGGSRNEIEKSLTIGLHQGHFAIILTGEKLQGEFIFQKLKKDPEDRSWLLIKKDDSYADEEEIIKKKSPRSTIKHSKMPEFISPMLATLVDKPFDDEEWLFEIKWDGFRALAFADKGKVNLRSRAKNLLNEKFPAIVKELKKIKDQAIFDGELVIVDSKGKSHFQLMQNYQTEKTGTLYYYVFDLLYKDGQDLRQLPLIERKEILKEYLQELSLPSVLYSDHIFNEGVAFFKVAAKEELEGVIGKKITSTYQSKRSRDWVKIKTTHRQEFIIGGFTAPKGSREKFGSLLIGIYNDENELCYAGHVGGGFNASLLEDVYRKLKPLIQKKCPFKSTPKPNSAATWVKPKLICEVAFTEWTKDNSLRHPVFQGLRMDKPPKNVKKEVPLKETSKTSAKSKRTKQNLTHLDKVYWPAEKYTKGDLIKYYETIAPYILPYLKDRPIMLRRFPEGINGLSFYQKDLTTYPEWIKTIPIQHEDKIVNYLLINNLESLLYAINLGSIDLHPFLSRYKKLKNPDFCVIDLDPHDVPFENLIETALVTHEILTEIKVKHFCKTSGGKGLHILIPLHAKYDYEQSRQFAEIIASYVHQQLPDFTSMERGPKKRPKKIYLDCLQNRIGQTIAAPYSVRPRPKATVSTPLAWEEVNKKLDLTKFTIETVPTRLTEKGDLFKDILGPGVNLKEALNRLKKNYS